jgi:hypothetical protein
MMTRSEDDFRNPEMANMARAEKRRDLVGSFIILGVFDVVFWVMWWKTAPGTPPLPVIPTAAIAIILAEKFLDLSDVTPEPDSDDGDLEPVHEDQESEHGARSGARNE